MKGLSAKMIAQTAIGVALLAVSAWLKIPIGPVPISLQTLVVFIIGLVWPVKQTTVSLMVYALLGLLGLPVFAGGTSGPAALTMPSFGFIIGMVLAGPVISWINQKVNSWLSLLAGQALIYSFGIVYMYVVLIGQGDALTVGRILQLAVLPFIVGDLLKMLAAVEVSKRLKKTRFIF